MIGSHTVPQSLLRRFAYLDDLHTKSWRLWRYAKSRRPYPNASPKTATRYEGHFADPENPGGEAEIETELANKYEHPVNAFIHRLGDSDFLLSDVQREQLTRYVTLLFLRSKSRRAGTKHLQAVKRLALDLFLSNDSQLLTVVTHWNIDLICRGIRLPRLLTPKDVATRALEDFQRLSEQDAEQHQYLVGIRNGMATLDEKMYRGDWNLLTTTPDRPFIISDSPVVTLKRDSRGTVYHGGGFGQPDVEVLLPVSPIACVHILPQVERTLPTIRPTVDEVNIAQAAFAYRDCFANVLSDDIDALVQRHISTARIGENVFTLWHRDYRTAFYDILMSGGNWRDPPDTLTNSK